jgi:IS30 family transposase
MAHVTDSLLEFIMERLNNRPRKKLGFATPKEAFFAEMEKNNIWVPRQNEWVIL